MTSRFQSKWIFADIALVCGIYSAWFLLVIFGNSLPLIVLFVLGGYVTCLHGSLQHIAVHGYPTRWKRLNELVVYPPLAFYYPYPTYRNSHLQHHSTEILTDAESDPESLYLSKTHWENLNAAGRMIYRFGFTLVGRLLIGPVVSLYLLWKSQAQQILNGDIACLRIWAVHLCACGAIMLFVVLVGEMALWKYIVCFVYPGISLTLLRSYTEHQWSDNKQERSIVIEGSPISRLLYLNNNFHWVHHDNPGLPWQEVARVFKERRAEILERNGHFYYRGYDQVLLRLLKDRMIDPVHPLQTS